MKRQDRKTQEEKPAGEEMLNLKSSSAVIGDADGEAADKWLVAKMLIRSFKMNEPSKVESTYTW